MEYSIPLCNTTVFLYSYYSSLITPLDVSCEDDCLGNSHIDSFSTCIRNAKYEQVNIYDVVFNQQYLFVDQQQDLFNIISKHKKYLMAPSDFILIKSSH